MSLCIQSQYFIKLHMFTILYSTSSKTSCEYLLVVKNQIWRKNPSWQLKTLNKVSELILTWGRSVKLLLSSVHFWFVEVSVANIKLLNYIISLSWDKCQQCAPKKIVIKKKKNYKKRMMKQGGEDVFVRTALSSLECFSPDTAIHAVSNT